MVGCHQQDYIAAMAEECPCLGSRQTRQKPSHRSVGALDLSLVDLDGSVAPAGEQAGTNGVPLDGSALVEGGVTLLLLGLVVGVPVLGSLILDLVGGLSEQLVLLGLEVPDLDSVLSADGDPGSLGVEGEAGHNSSSIEFSEGLAAVVEVPDLDLLVLTTGDNEGSLGGGGDGIDVAVVSLEAILDLEGLVVPDLKASIPSGGSEEAASEVPLGGVAAEEADVADPVGVALLVLGESADTLDIPELDGLVGTSRQDLTVVAREAAAQHLLGVANEPFSALSLSEIPESEGAIPTGRQQVVVVAGEADVADEVAVTGEALPGLGEVLGVLALGVELPDDDGLVATARNKDLSVLVLLDGVAGGDGRNPTVMALKVTLLDQLDSLLSVGHEYHELINQLFNIPAGGETQEAHTILLSSPRKVRLGTTYSGDRQGFPPSSWRSGPAVTFGCCWAFMPKLQLLLKGRFSMGQFYVVVRFLEIGCGDFVDRPFGVETGLLMETGLLDLWVSWIRQGVTSINYRVILPRD